MKVFEFDPKTGRRGEQIDIRPLAGWADCSLEFLASKGETVPACVVPNLPKANWCTHIDAGRETYSKADGITFVSYKHDTKWLCFCIGQLTCGLDEGYWEWWIIPSKEAYTATGEAAANYQSWRD